MLGIAPSFDSPGTGASIDDADGTRLATSRAHIRVDPLVTSLLLGRRF